MHVLHHICAKVVDEEWRVKPLWIRYFISPGVYIFHPVPPSPRPSGLWFFSFFCLLKELTVLLSVSALSECLCCALFPSPSVWWEKLEITMSGGGVRPLCSLFHLFSLCSHFARWQWCSLQISCRCGPFDTFQDKMHTPYSCAHTYTCKWRALTCLRLNIHIKFLAHAHTALHSVEMR